VWDFDSKDNPQHALNDARGFVEHLAKNGIPPEDLIPFASGRKGIHIASRYLLSPRDDWYQVFDHVASQHWNTRFPTLDAGIHQNRALIRAPWSRHQAHPTARKKPIPPELFFGGRWAEIEAWAKAPLNDRSQSEIPEQYRERPLSPENAGLNPILPRRSALSEIRLRYPAVTCRAPGGLTAASLLASCGALGMASFPYTF
jgi:hypothetical protein